MICKALLAIVALFCFVEAKYRGGKWNVGAGKYFGGTYRYPVAEREYGAQHRLSYGYKWVAPEPVLYGGHYGSYGHSSAEPAFYGGHYRSYGYSASEPVLYRGHYESYGHSSPRPFWHGENYASYRYSLPEPMYGGHYGSDRFSVPEPEWGPWRHYKSGPEYGSLHREYAQRNQHFSSSSQIQSQSGAIQIGPIDLLVLPTEADNAEPTAKHFSGRMVYGTWW